jgi:large subunit ribosomal protein L30
MSDKSIKVTLIKSMAGQLANIRASARGLGLRRIGHTVVVADTPANRGMMYAANHMLRVEPADGKPADGRGSDGKKTSAAAKRV